ncbi:hypothetical protein TanjilG_24510 [Lupinus angustifolius]|uniref:WW domain-containing protein n=1 Tax=Lupinus angustifolius TaxID=3871 RepID=A0A394DGR5_LUPAN|nr:hypothetical protein TanjilG_24510 [Lupinus angustifolius]
MNFYIHFQNGKHHNLSPISLPLNNGQHHNHSQNHHPNHTISPLNHLIPHILLFIKKSFSHNLIIHHLRSMTHSQPWKEYLNFNGMKYFYNNMTNEYAWEIPHPTFFSPTPSQILTPHFVHPPIADLFVEIRDLLHKLQEDLEDGHNSNVSTQRQI